MGATTDPNPARIDALISDLRSLRLTRGVSYRELATLVSERRVARGVNPAAARVAHTTISDAFKPGRRRLNAGLIADIIEALDGDAETVAEWRARVAAVTAAASPSPDPPPRLDDASAPGAPRSSTSVALLILAGLLLNSAGKFVNPLLGDVFFFDMVGTAVVALLAGPWAAAGVGILFIAVELLKGEAADAMFAGTMVTAGLIWGFGVREFGAAQTLSRFLVLSGVVAITTSLLAVPITVLFLDGDTSRGLDELRDLLAGSGADLWAAVGAVNLTVSLADKLLVGAAAYGTAVLTWRSGIVPSPLQPTPRLGA